MATPFLSASLRPAPSTTKTLICKTCHRTTASYRRTRKALRVKLDPSFAPSQTATTDHIIFNPPPSIPNVYHTPAKFLPASDPRRALYNASQHTAENPPTPAAAAAAPRSILASIAAERNALAAPAKALQPVRPIREKKYHLTETKIAEMRRLRAEDPRHWTRLRLAEKFDCSDFFVGLCCSAPEMAKVREKEAEAVRAKWGRRKREAREARVERRKLWGMDA